MTCLQKNLFRGISKENVTGLFKIYKPIKSDVRGIYTRSENEPTANAKLKIGGREREPIRGARVASLSDQNGERRTKSSSLFANIHA